LFSSAGGTVSLTSLQGKSTLLYFQEGLTCQPCWDQIKDLERSSAAVKAAGVDQVVSITTDPADLIAQKTSDEGLTTPVLSDPDLAVSRAYHANDYGMMGDSRNGHTFLLVDPQGQITWRADYGGPPDFTMFVPVSQLLADLKSASSS
jgi:peroxiredoxin Q/BCP